MKKSFKVSKLESSKSSYSADLDFQVEDLSKANSGVELLAKRLSFEDFVENILFFPSGIFHNLTHLIAGFLAGGKMTRNTLWDLQSGECDFKLGPVGSFVFGAAPFFLLLVSVYLYLEAFKLQGSMQLLLFYLAFCSGFAAKPSGRDFRYMKTANNSCLGVVAIPINAFTEIYKKAFFGLSGNLAISISTFLIASFVASY